MIVAFRRREEEKFQEKENNENESNPNISDDPESELSADDRRMLDEWRESGAVEYERLRSELLKKRVKPVRHRHNEYKLTKDIESYFIVCTTNIIYFPVTVIVLSIAS